MWNGLVNTYPALIARCAGAVDVMTAVDFAREHDVRLSVKSGGHHETGNAVVQSGLVVDEDGALTGIVSLDDLVATIGEQLDNVSATIEVQSPDYSP